MSIKAIDFPLSLKQLEEVIKAALLKTESEKEIDLCVFIPYEDQILSPSQYFQLKDSNPEKLLELIEDHILKGTFKNLSNIKPSLPYTGKSLEDCIKEAMKKLNVTNEIDLCKYLPAEGEGYLHHFTYFKMKSVNPIQARNLIQKYILDQRPKRITPKIRLSRTTPSTKEPIQPQKSKEVHLSEIISKAMSRKGLNLHKEEDLCRFLPNGDSFLHPMAYRSLKIKSPNQLAKLIIEYVIDPLNPKKLEWRKKVPSSRQPNRKPSSLDKPELVKKSDESEMHLLMKMMAELLQTVKSESATTSANRYSFDLSERELKKRSEKSSVIHFYYIQNQLLKKILTREVDEDLWRAYCEINN